MIDRMMIILFSSCLFDLTKLNEQRFLANKKNREGLLSHMSSIDELFNFVDAECVVQSLFKKGILPKTFVSETMTLLDDLRNYHSEFGNESDSFHVANESWIQLRNRVENVCFKWVRFIPNYQWVNRMDFQFEVDGKLPVYRLENAYEVFKDCLRLCPQLLDFRPFVVEWEPEVFVEVDDIWKEDMMTVFWGLGREVDNMASIDNNTLKQLHDEAYRRGRELQEKVQKRVGFSFRVDGAEITSRI